MASKLVFFLFYFGLFARIALTQRACETKSTLSDMDCMQVVSSNVMELHWTTKYHSTHTWTFDFAVRAKATGYAAAGFSATGGMLQTDAVIGWVTTSSTNINPYRLTERSESGVNIDNNQVISEKSGEEKDGWTTIKYSRNLNNGGQTVVKAPHESDALNDMVFSYSNTDGIEYHTSRFQRKVSLLIGENTCSSATQECSDDTHCNTLSSEASNCVSEGSEKNFTCIHQKVEANSDGKNLYRGVFICDSTLSLRCAWKTYDCIINGGCATDHTNHIESIKAGGSDQLPDTVKTILGEDCFVSPNDESSVSESVSESESESESESSTPLSPASVADSSTTMIFLCFFLCTLLWA